MVLHCRRLVRPVRILDRDRAPWRQEHGRRMATSLHILEGAMTNRFRPPLWLIFLALGFMWGSSYLWIKIGVQTIPPFTLIALRLFFGFLVIATVVALAREPLPRSPRQYGHLFVMAIVNIVLPFFLIT